MLGVVAHTFNMNLKKTLAFESCDKESIWRNKKYTSSQETARPIVVFIIPSECAKGITTTPRPYDVEDGHHTEGKDETTKIIKASFAAISKEIHLSEILQSPSQALLDFKEIKIPLEYKSKFLLNLNLSNDIIANAEKAEETNVMSTFFEKMFNNLMAFNQSWISETYETTHLLWFNKLERFLKDVHRNEQLCLLDEKNYVNEHKQALPEDTKLGRTISSSTFETPKGSVANRHNRCISPNFIRIWQFMNIGSAFLLTLYLRSANICILLAANHCFAIIINAATYSYKINLYFKNSIFTKDEPSKNRNIYSKLLDWTNDHYNVLKQLVSQKTLATITRNRPKPFKIMKRCKKIKSGNTLHLSSSKLKPLYYGSAIIEEKYSQNNESIFSSDAESFSSGSASQSLSESASFLSLTSVETSYRVGGSPGTATLSTDQAVQVDTDEGYLNQQISVLVDTCKAYYGQTKDWLTKLVDDTDLTDISMRLNHLCPSVSTRNLINEFVQEKSSQLFKGEFLQCNRFVKDLGQNLAFTLFSSSSLMCPLKV